MMLRTAMRPIARSVAISFLLAAAAVAAGGEPGSAREPITTFVRFQEAKDGGAATLETAHASYASTKTDVEVVLYGAVHIADKAYYAAVQRDLAAHDVVLYEGVSGGKDAKPDENAKALAELQTAFGAALGFQYQKDGIDYAATNFVHADMTYEQLLERTGGDISKALPDGAQVFSNPDLGKLLKPALELMKAMGKDGGEMRAQLKLRLGRQLASTDIASISSSGNVQKILIEERNEVALRVLDRELEKRKTGTISIFYGAAHLKDLHRRLAERGWTQRSVAWNVAWTIGGDTASPGGAEECPAKPMPVPAAREMVELAENGLAACQREVTSGAARIEELARWSARIIDARREIGDLDGARAALEKHVERLRALENDARARRDVSAATSSEVLTAGYLRAEAEARLARERK